jgi:outer membrane protein OmpA-like peptidoglycan-associated protein
MTRIFFVTAVGLGVLLTAVGRPAFAQSENDFVNGLRPVPPALQNGRSGLPTFGPAARPPASPNYHSTSARMPATVSSGAGQGASTHRAYATAATTPGKCPAHADLSGKPQVSSTNISFEFGSSVLTPQAKDVLRNLGNALNGPLKDQKSIEIDGHTDAVGTYAFNEQLSWQRAQAAKDFLVHEMSIAPDRLKVIGRAYCDPADPTNPDGAANRRVVFVNQG